MRIVDAHFHLWDLEENYYPWLRDGDRSSIVHDYSSLRRNYLISDFLADIGDLPVAAAVHIQAEHDYSDHVRETRWLQRVADDPGSRGMPQAIVANADLASADAESVLAAHCGFRNMRGIRQAVHRRLHESPAYDPLLDPVWRRNFRLLRKYDLSFDLQLFPEQGDAAVDLARENPDVQIVLTHAGMPIRRDREGVELWRSNIRRFAQSPNVSVKLSGLALHEPHWKPAAIHPILETVIEHFTPDRCMLASNYPVEGISKRYAEIWTIFGDYFAGYSPAEREKLFYSNAVGTYRIEI
jgi:predicted TIM-barrel fold metal-dependent hydrolase